MDIENKYGSLELQKQLLEILRLFDYLCKENGVVYSVMGGTELGAIRHKGFIPWDDDLDITLDRENYTKLNKILPNDILGFEREDIAPWVKRVKNKKRHTVFDGHEPMMDIFIMDNAPDNAIASKLKMTTLRMLQGMMKKKPTYKRYSFLGKFLSLSTYIMGLPFSLSTKLKWYDCVSRWGNSSKTKQKMLSNDAFKPMRLRYPSDILENIIRVPFEDMMVNAMSGYHDYLTLCYGDYMTPPEESKRVPGHTME